MIYPQKLNSRNGDKIVNILLVFSLVLALLLVIINKLTTPDIHWSGLANCGIIYVWVTVIYSIKRSTNIGSHVFLQMIVMSAIVLYIDKVTGAKGWATNIAIPIILMVANITMLILTIIRNNKYIKYAIYQLMIVLISLIPVIFIAKGMMELRILIMIAILTSIISLSFSLVLCYRDIKEVIIRKIHM